MAPAVTATTVSDDDPQKYEDEHVHAVYDQIAPHFSSTRYKVRLEGSLAELSHVVTAVNTTYSRGRLSQDFSRPFHPDGWALTRVRAMASISPFRSSDRAAYGPSGSTEAEVCSRLRARPAGLVW